MHPEPVHSSGNLVTQNPYSSVWWREDPESMQLGHTSFTPEEKEQPHKANLYSGGAGHFVYKFREIAKAPQ